MCAFDHCFRGNAVDAILTPLRRAKKWTPNITLPFGVALYLLRRQTQTKHTSLTRNTALVVIEKGLLSTSASGCTTQRCRSRSEEDWRALFDTLYEDQAAADTTEARAVAPVVPEDQDGQAAGAARTDEEIPDSRQ